MSSSENSSAGKLSREMEGSFIEFLLKRGILSKEIYDRAKEHAAQTDKSINDIIKEEELITADLFDRSLAEYLHMPTSEQQALFPNLSIASAMRHSSDDLVSPLLNAILGEERAEKYQEKLVHRAKQRRTRHLKKKAQKMIREMEKSELRNTLARQRKEWKKQQLLRREPELKSFTSKMADTLHDRLISAFDAARVNMSEWKEVLSEKYSESQKTLEEKRADREAARKKRLEKIRIVKEDRRKDKELLRQKWDDIREQKAQEARNKRLETEKKSREDRMRKKEELERKQKERERIAEEKKLNKEATRKKREERKTLREERKRVASAERKIRLAEKRGQWKIKFANLASLITSSDDTHLREEARKEAMKQVLIEQEKEKLRQRDDGTAEAPKRTETVHSSQYQTVTASHAENRRETEADMLARLALEKEKIRSQAFAEAQSKTHTTQEVLTSGGATAIEEEKQKLIQERAMLESEKSLIREQAMKDAHMQFEKERTQWDIEKERIREQAIVEAESRAIASGTGVKGVFGLKKNAALDSEIEKWKKEAAKLEKERLDLQREKALQEEKERMRQEQRKIEEEKIRLEREKIAQEQANLSEEMGHKELISREKEQLAEDKKSLEEIKQEQKGNEGTEKSKKESKMKLSLKKKNDKKKGKKSEKEEKKGEEKISLQETVDIGKILLEQNYIEEAELSLAKKKAEERNVSIDHILKEDGLVTKDLIQNAIAEYYKMPFVDLAANPPDTTVIELLPEAMATSLHAISIVRKENGTIVVATCSPDQGEQIRQEVKNVIPAAPEIEMVYASKETIESALTFYRKPLDTRFRSIIEEHKKIAPEIIEEIFADAVQLGASDIHFEPQEKAVVVRFRVDGVMHEAGRLPREYYEGIVNRIKIAGNMRIDEHFAAQDGAIRWKSGDRAMDVRVSIVPIVDGEKIVMRLLSEYVRTLTLSDLGFTTSQLNVLVKAAHKPFGMILTTGPTGSGKSTTLYGLMKIRNSPDVNISTIEDPVEYKIPGINHIQVNAKSNLTFERGLRALVRQDPDIILVGEIRDDITAQISVNAALTGHLLFSTLHANDAATAVPRLLEMGIEPYLLASTMELIIAQRLMRKICKSCRYSQNISYAQACQLFPGAERYFADEDGKDVTLFRGKGCSACGGTGYKGRVGVYELLVVSQNVEDAIVERRTSGEIGTIARKEGMLTLFEDGLDKVKAGASTIEELMRIAAPPDILDKS